MTIRVDRTKMAMDGNVFTYDVVVPASELDCAGIHHFIVRDSVRYASLVDALRPVELDAMPRGFARYDAFKAHEADTLKREKIIIHCVYPETEGHDPLSYVTLSDAVAGYQGWSDTRFTDRPWMQPTKAVAE